MPKQKPGEFRVIHHLSFPEGLSINDGIPKEFSAVTYQTVDDAVTLIKRFGKGALLAKTDIEHGYKNIPIHPRDHELLGFAIGHDIYYDKTLPMGLSSACSLFEHFSSSLHWIVNNKLGIEGCVHMLDDFFVSWPTLSFSMYRSSRIIFAVYATDRFSFEARKNCISNNNVNILRIGIGY